MAVLEASGCRGDLVYQTLADLVDHRAGSRRRRVHQADSVCIRLRTYPACGPGGDRLDGARRAQGDASRCGRRITQIGCLWPWAFSAWARAWCRSTQREAMGAYILERSGARLLVTIQGFLDTDYLDLLAALKASRSKPRHPARRPR